MRLFEQRMTMLKDGEPRSKFYSYRAQTQSLLHIHLLAIFFVHVIRQLHGHTVNKRQFRVLYEPFAFVSHLYPVELDHIQRV